jgi:Ca2+-binding RTX toxin-like protein
VSDLRWRCPSLEVTGSGVIQFGLSPAPCGAATTVNTDAIRVVGAGGSTERLIIDQFDGLLGPGAASEATGRSEIEVSVELGDASDEVVVRGSPDEEPLAVGSKGVSFNADSDVDITFSSLPASIELVAAGGMPHVLRARGGFGSGQVFPGAVTLRAGDLGDTLTGSDFADLLVGGDGDDFIHGSAGDDVINGGEGNDRLRGAGEDDFLSGGPGADTFSGSYGDDVIDAHDGVVDLQLNGGPGVDTAAYDRDLDPRPLAVENRRPLDPPPPPPPGPDPVTGCGFAGGVFTATIAPGDEATLTVGSGSIRFGAPAEDCGGATTSNTDRIVVTGASRTRETLVIDLRGGQLAPGASPEGTGRAEIEVRVELHDVVDVIQVIASHSGSFLAVGRRGISVNADGDVDVTVAPYPVTVSLVGGRGRDRLSAGGGFGAGGRFAGSVELRGAGAADVLVGGNGIDTMWGGPGADRLVGGRRSDSFSGGAGNDVLRAVDRLRDRKLDGDGGRDEVYFDRGRDRPVECELLRPRG